MAKDVFHDAVRYALENDGWTITNDPLRIRFGDVDQYVDLGAEKFISAEKGDRKIAVEVKSFLGSSPVTEFHIALGQYLNYRVALTKEEPERILYLAIPTAIFNSFFALPFTQAVIEEYSVRLIVFQADAREIEKWIE
jgi:hypothetical protein